MSMTAHRRRSANGNAVTVAELAARLRSVPEPESPATTAAPPETSVSVGELLWREGRPSPVEVRPVQPRRQRAATERFRRTSRSQALAAVAGAAVVCGSVLAGELVNRYLDERDTNSAEVFGPDGSSRADQHKAAIPTTSVQVFRPIPAALPQPPPRAAGTFPATGAPGDRRVHTTKQRRSDDSPPRGARHLDAADEPGCPRGEPPVAGNHDAAAHSGYAATLRGPG